MNSSTSNSSESLTPNNVDDERIRDALTLTDTLDGLRDAMHAAETRFAAALEQIHPEQQASARNLLHYVALRRHDLRPLQEQLVQRGLSSLGRCESHVLENVTAVMDHLSRLTGHAVRPPPVEPIGYRSARQLIESRATALLGPPALGRGVLIMVTMPSEAATDYKLVRNLVATGMNCMRINCAHDDESAWSGMIANLRRAESELGCSCRIAMDLGGPKIRTGPIEPGPSVVRWRPHRDERGHTVTPARIWLTAARHQQMPPSPADAVLPVEGEWLSRVQVGDEIRLRDERGRRRTLQIVDAVDGGYWAECDRTGYVTPGLRLRHFAGARRTERKTDGRVGDIPPITQSLTLQPGDRIHLTDASQAGRAARYDSAGSLITPACIGCTLPEVFESVRPGERILFDDGRLGGIVEAVHPRYLEIMIEQTGPQGSRLRADKGINFPDSQLHLPALTEKDLRDLDFVARHADAVSYSFVHRSDDVYRLQAELERLGRPDLGIILKIENRKAVERLARLLLAVMRSPVSGVMIARGDLAVECGWQRLAEVQEEILWMCEAAHMPVVWATQVLESMARTGLPSRAEVTDAAMGVRAECVMLNKGPHIVATVRALDDILRRMQDHQVKKRPMLRRLSLADDLLPLPD